MVAAVLAGVLAMSFGARTLVLPAVLAYVLAALMQRHLPPAHRAAG